MPYNPILFLYLLNIRKYMNFISNISILIPPTPLVTVNSTAGAIIRENKRYIAPAVVFNVTKGDESLK